jgi:arsenite methyltransferase
MKIPNTDDQELGICCADFYNHPAVVNLLDGIFHPGGLALSNLMAEMMGIDSTSRILDIACGDGMTSTYLAKKFSCFVAGIDAGSNMIDLAKERARKIGVEQTTEFRVGFAANIPFANEEFNAAYSECAVCTFQEKQNAVLEIKRILKPSGILGINDVVIQDEKNLDAELKGLIGQVACVAGALSSEGYIQLFEQNKFSHLGMSIHSDLLQSMVEKAHGKAKMRIGIEEKLSGTTSINDILRIINLIKDQITSGNMGYEMFIFQKIQ